MIRRHTVLTPRTVLTQRGGVSDAWLWTYSIRTYGGTYDKNMYIDLSPRWRCWRCSSVFVTLDFASSDEGQKKDMKNVIWNTWKTHFPTVTWEKSVIIINLYITAKTKQQMKLNDYYEYVEPWPHHHTPMSQYSYTVTYLWIIETKEVVSSLLFFHLCKQNS